MMINKENLQQSRFCFTLAVLIIIISIYLLSLCTHCICAKCRGRTLKQSCADPESFVKGGPNLIMHFLVVEGIEDLNNTINGPLSARQRNAI